jgi:chemotaxis signal transduction protein
VRDAASILRARAQALAVRDQSELERSTEELATFSIGGHAIGVPMEHVAHASALKHLTEIPGGPGYLVGLTAVEGHLVSLLDLAAFLELARQGVGDVTGALVVSWKGRELGLAAEQLHGIEDVPKHTIASLPGGVGPLARIARRTSGGDLLLLDVETLIDDPRLGAVTRGLADG